MNCKTGVTVDHIIEVVSQEKVLRLRHIDYRNLESGKHYELLTNYLRLVDYGGGLTVQMFPLLHPRLTGVQIFASNFLLVYKYSDWSPTYLTNNLKPVVWQFFIKEQ